MKQTKKQGEKKFENKVILVILIFNILFLGLGVSLGLAIDSLRFSKGVQGCDKEVIREWNNITLEKQYGDFGYISENYYAYFPSDTFGVGCDKDVQLLKIGDSFTAISNHSGSKCFVYTIKEVCKEEAQKQNDE